MNIAPGKGRKAKFFSPDRRSLKAKYKQCSVETCDCEDPELLNIHHIVFRSEKNVPRNFLRSAELNGEVVYREHESRAHKQGLMSGCSIRAYALILEFFKKADWLHSEFESSDPAGIFAFKAIQELLICFLPFEQPFQARRVIQVLPRLSVNDIHRGYIEMIIGGSSDVWWSNFINDPVNLAI